MSLFVVATPIGNLQDVSLRSLEILKSVDLVLAEDTRVTKKLLNKFEIKTRLLSYHQHSKLNKVEHIINLLVQGKDLALVSDAGTPGISDPGNKLVREAVLKEIRVIPIPGPSASISALSVSGFPTDKFVFLGFPPQKKKRQSFFKEVLESKYPVVLYESKHRILKTLKELQDREIVLARELTKVFETIYRGKANEIDLKEIKGEFVIVVNKRMC